MTTREGVGMGKDHDFLHVRGGEKAQKRIEGALSHYFTHVMPFPAFVRLLVPAMSHKSCQEIFEHPDAAICERLSTLSNALAASNVFEIPQLETCEQEGCGIDIRMAAEKMGELVARVQAQLMTERRSTFKGKVQQHGDHMLTLGMRKANERATAISLIGQTVIDEVHVNECATRIIFGAEWHALLAVVGVRVMEHILRSTAVFVPIDGSSSNFIQVLGISIGDVRPLAKAISSPDSRKGDAGSLDLSPCLRRKRKRQRVKSDKDKAQVAASERRMTKGKKRKEARKGSMSSAGSIDFLRSHIFYAKPFHTRAKQIVTGLPPRHILGRSTILAKHANNTQTERTLSHVQSMASRARIVSKYIWPCAYKLKNVWTIEGKRSAGSNFRHRANLAHREAEIKAKGAQRTPKRLRSGLQLVKVMLAKHDRFDFRRALDLCCPRTLPKRKLTPSERDQIVGDLCEVGATQSQYYTQRMQIRQDEHEEWNSANVENSKARFTRYKASHGCVARFVRLAVREIVPMEMFGSLHNRSVFLQAVTKFVCARRYESMNVHEMMQGFRLLDCQWLLPPSRRALHQRPGQAEMAKRRNLLNEWIFWLIDGFVVPLLRTNFYATESAKFRNRILYFRHHDWYTITQPILEKLKEDCFERLDKHKAVAIMSRRDFGYSFVRLLPKEVGVRPIINLRRRSEKVDRKAKGGRRPRQEQFEPQNEWGNVVRQHQSINMILNATFHVFNYEKGAHPADLGSSVSGPQDIFDRLSAFKRALQAHHGGGSLPRLYFVKVDVAGAFDCIDQDKLLLIVDETIRHARYIVQRHTRLTSTREKPVRTWPRVVCPEEEHEGFEELIAGLASVHNLRNSIFSDGVTHGHCDRESLLWLMDEHVKNNLIKVGKDFCRQRVGIPQGSTLSTLMCCYYLARMERDLGLEEDKKGEMSLLMRYTDDFLFISTDIERARAFFTAIHKGSEQFNCTIAAEKSRSNFPVVHHSMDATTIRIAANVVREGMVDEEGDCSTFAWCGHQIDTRSLAVRYDFERYAGSCLADTLTIPGRNAFYSVLSRIVGTTVQRRNVMLYLDEGLNGVKGVLLNIHESFLLGTLKFVAALIELQRRFRRNTVRLRRSLSDAARMAQAKTMMGYLVENVEHSYAHACAKVQSCAQSCKPSGERWPIAVNDYRFLAYHAICSTFRVRGCTATQGVQSLAEKKLEEVQRRLEGQKERQKGPREKDVREYVEDLRLAADESIQRMMPIVRTIK